MGLALKKNEKLILFASLAVIGWLIISRRILRMTMTDKKAKSRFASMGVRLHTDTKVVDGHEVHYAWTGNRSLPVLLFIHGSPQSWTFFSDYLRDDLLLERFRIVSVDRPGFGQSDFGNALRLPEQVEILAKFLDAIAHDQPVYLVGHSFGAPLAVAIAALRPGRVKTIVLAAGALDPSAESAAAWRKLLMLPPMSSFLPGAMKPSNEELYYLGEDLYQIQSRFMEVQCPVFLVHAFDDQIVPHAQSETAARMFINAPKVRMITLPSGGHFFPKKRFFQFRDLLVNGLRPELASY
jgi:pimeloyl-ACP methyl ester carboxylesterase